jgi:tetratricopeptide (TPR) repeat protein
MLRCVDKLWVWIWVLSLLWLGGCDRMITSRNTQLIKEADAKSAQGDFLWAINLYEAALDGTPESAEIHYKLALIYDGKMNDPLDALHHFKRYLTLNPNGKHAAEVRGFIKRDEVALATSLSGDSILTRTEATKLRNENLNLRKQLEERWSKAHGPAAEKAAAHHAKSKKTRKTHGHTYIVKRGDTLDSISRKFYKSSAHWKEILDANRKSIDDPDNLKVGQRLKIP